MEYSHEYLICFYISIFREIVFANELAEALMEDDILSMNYLIFKI